MSFWNKGIKPQGLLSKTGSYGREILVIGHRQFENQVEAVWSPSKKTIYFDRDMFWNLEVKRFIDFNLDDNSVDESDPKDVYNVMKLIHQCYQDSVYLIYNSEPS